MYTCWSIGGYETGLTTGPKGLFLFFRGRLEIFWSSTGKQVRRARSEPGSRVMESNLNDNPSIFLSFCLYLIDENIPRLGPYQSTSALLSDPQSRLFIVGLNLVSHGTENIRLLIFPYIIGHFPCFFDADFFHSLSVSILCTRVSTLYNYCIFLPPTREYLVVLQ